ncbi:MAG: response regulator [Acidobacteria bacterium]|nr:response regulator [Acidobacteriota bacterium]
MFRTLQNPGTFFPDSFQRIENDNIMNVPFDAATTEIFDQLFALYGTITPSGKVLDLAGRIFEKTRLDPRLLIGQQLTETVFWQSSEQSYRMIADAVEAAGKGIRSNTVLEFRVDKTEKIFLELDLCPVYRPENDERRLTHIFLCGRDVTAREKEIEFYKRRSEQLLYAAESADVGLWFWDLNEGKIFSTPKCNAFFDLSKYDTIRYPDFLETVFPDDRRQLIDVFLESQKNGTEYDVEYRVIHSDGGVEWLSTKGKTYLDADGSPVSMMGIVRRITDRKNADREISRVYELERKARDEAEEANRAKDYFLAFVSHELRSPLNAVLGWTKILLTKQVDEATRRNALETIERSATAQAKLISDLVDSSRIASGKLRLELRPMNLFDALNTVINSQKPLADSRKISLDFDNDSKNIVIFGDLIRIQQVFTNLLTNALKFTPDGGHIRIAMKTGGNEVAVSLRDDGQGISPEALPKIFRQFAQGDQNISRDQNGLGLGLSIVKTLVEKHEGRVTAESDGIGCGACFTVVLPLFKQAPAVSALTEKIAVGKETPLAGLRILLIEDDHDSREVLQLFLEQNGAQVESAESAAGAFAVLENGAGVFDVIVSDLAMPNEDGYSLISRIRSFPTEKGGRIPALALSAFAAKDCRERAFSAGFQKYHTKPFDPDQLIRDILGLIGKQSEV